MKLLILAALVVASFAQLHSAEPKAIAGPCNLVIKSDGSLWSWGTGTAGQLGNGKLLNQAVPGRVGTNLWRTLAAGSLHVLAIQADGTLWGWGSNSRGQLGNGAKGSISNVPVQIGTDSDWVTVAAGFDFSLGLRGDGSLWALGSNAEGQLGNGSTSNTNRPTQVGTNTDWAAVAAGSDHVIALKTDGGMWSWGCNVIGALGDGTRTSRSLPAQIATNQTWNAVACGNDHTLAVSSGGELWAWGLGQFGELGTGDTTNRFLPTRIGTDTDWATVFSGPLGYQSCGLKRDGSLWIWGGNVVGQLGIGTSGTNILSPVSVGVGKWIAASFGPPSSIALRSDESVWTSGYGYLGDGTFFGEHDSFAPVIPILQSDFVQTEESQGVDIDVLANASDLGSQPLILTATSGAKHGQLEVLTGSKVRYTPTPGYYGTDTFTYTAANAAGGQASAFVNVVVVANSALEHPPLAVMDFAQTEPGVPVEIPVLENDSDFEGDVLILTGFSQGSDGTVSAASPTSLAYVPRADFHGEDSFTYSVADAKGGTATGVVQVLVGRARPKVVAGGYRTMLLRSDGTLWGWGANESGQLGDGTLTDRTVPVQIGNSDLWRDLDGDWSFTVARQAGGTLWAWGYNSEGELGIGTTKASHVPVQVGTDTDWSTFAVSRNHTVALKQNGSLWSWGANYDGQLGTGVVKPALTPTRVGSDTDWKAVFAGVGFSMAQKKNGTLWAWGFNALGALGDGTTTSKPTPIQVGSQTNWLAVFPGNDFVLAVQTDGSLWGWGQNSSAQLGDGSVIKLDSSVPNQRTSPIRIGQDLNWLQLAGGFTHSLGLRQNGTLWAWGGYGGQLGLKVNDSLIPTPVQVGTKSDWVAVSAGEAHSVGIDAAGRVWSWGSNDYGQLGIGTTGSVLVPTLLEGFGADGFRIETALTRAGMSMSWATAAKGFVIESTGALSGPWSPVAGLSGTVTNAANRLLTPYTGAAGFFRLRKPE